MDEREIILNNNNLMYIFIIEKMATLFSKEKVK